MGVTEEIVQVAERLLIRAHQERAQQILLAVLKVMQLDPLLHVVVVHKSVNLAVGIAGQIGDRRLAGGTLTEAMNRRNREQLVDGPHIGHALEDREVAEIRIAQRALQISKLLGRPAHGTRNVANLGAACPEDVVDQCTVFQTHEADAEQAQRLVAILKHVVVVLNQPTLSDVLVDVKDVHQRSWQFGLASRRRWQLSGNRETVQPIGAEYVKDQDTLLRNHGAARLTDDGWMGHALFIAHGHDLVDHVGRVLLQRVVHGELKAGLAAVVIDAQPAANIDVLHSRAGLGQLRIDAREFIDPLIHLTNVMNLAAHVAMQKLQAIFHSLGTKD